MRSHGVGTSLHAGPRQLPRVCVPGYGQGHLCKGHGLCRTYAGLCVFELLGIDWRVDDVLKSRECVIVCSFTMVG